MNLFTYTSRGMNERERIRSNTGKRGEAEERVTRK